MVNKKRNRWVRSGLQRILRSAGDLLLARRCQVCEAPCESDNLCQICHFLLKKQRLISDHACVRCALPLPTAAGGMYCAGCLQQRPRFERCIAATLYAPVSAHLVNGLKHRGQLGVAHTLAAEMARAVRELNSPHTQVAALQNSIDLVVPVPLHWRRLRQRGYNQAVQISRPLCQALELPLDIHACVRREETRAQQALTRQQRDINLRGAFAANYRVAGKRVAIVDDVVTTTSTANAVADSLLKAGAVACEVWCFARTPAPD